MWEKTGAPSLPIFGFDPYELARQLLDNADQESTRPADFGPYRFLDSEPLGRGSMGEVWRAEEEAVGRTVAVKFLRNTSEPGVWASREMRRLGALEHKFIARLYLPGALEDGTPWLAMEYVEGESLDVYVTERRPSIKQRLALFRAICEAVQYAHGRRIVHGDLKPSNIRVNNAGEPKLLDFGLAEQFQNPDCTTASVPGGLGFTPAYAAPEQFRGDPVSVSIDIYSLGVILYELLSGILPFNASRRTYAEIGELKTSARLPDPPSLLASRQSTELSQSDWRELDALCLKCLESNVDHRYSSVEALLQDLDRYTRGEPLTARLPHSYLYRIGKFLKRNRRVVLAASLAVLSLVAMVAFFTARLAHERNKALAEAARTQRIQRFTLDLMGQGDQQAAPSKDVPVVAALDRGAANIATFNADPETQVELCETLGRMYEQLNKFPQAETLLRLGLAKARTLGTDNPKTIGALVQLGLLRGDQAQFAEAERSIRQALELAGTRHLPPDDPAVLDAQSALGRILVQTGSYDKAIALLDPLTRRPPIGEAGTVTLLESLTALGVADYYSGRYDAAQSAYARALQLDRSFHGNSHPRVAYDLSNLATTDAVRGNYLKAENLYREAARILEAWYGPDQPETVQIKSFVGLMAMQRGDNAEAERLLRNVLPLQERAYGTSVHPAIALTHDTVGKLAVKRGDLAAAEAEFSRAFEISDKLYGGKDYKTAITASNLADVFVRQGFYARAEKTVRPALKTLTDPPRPGNPSVGIAELTLGVSLLRQNRYHEAEQPLSAAYEVLKKSPNAYPTRLQDARKDLIELYQALHQPAKAAAFRAAPSR